MSQYQLCHWILQARPGPRNRVAAAAAAAPPAPAASSSARPSEPPAPPLAEPLPAQPLAPPPPGLVGYGQITDPVMFLGKDWVGQC